MLSLRRRALLAFAAIAAALSIAAGVTPAHAATGHARITWGVNRNYWPQFKAAVPLAKAVRVYYDNPDPATWPQTWPTRAGGAWVLLSMRPEPGPLLAGLYDPYFRHLLSTAPAHSLLTIWHEDAVGNDPLGYTGAVRNPATYRRMQEHMERLVRGTRARFGTLGCGPVSQAEQWYAPGLDWYGYDLYLNDRYLTGGSLRNGPMGASPFVTKTGTLSKAKVWARMDANLAAIRRVSHERYPAIRLGESNAAPDSYRRAWFADVASWFASHDGQRPAWVLTYWNAAKSHAAGGLSGPWPPSRGVIDELNTLTRAYS